MVLAGSDRKDIVKIPDSCISQTFIIVCSHEPVHLNHLKGQMFWLPACKICLLQLLISNTKCTVSRDEGAKSAQTRGVGILHYEAINLIHYPVITPRRKKFRKICYFAWLGMKVIFYSIVIGLYRLEITCR